MQVVEAGNDFGVEYTVSERRDGKNKTYQGAGSADVEKCASGSNRRANQNECAERAHERGEGNEKRITRSNVMMAAGEEMAEFVGEENSE